jgi:hypothetical protein
MYTKRGSSPALFFLQPSAADGACDQYHASAALPPGKETQCSFYRISGFQIRSITIFCDSCKNKDVHCIYSLVVFVLSVMKTSDFATRESFRNPWLGLRELEKLI